MEQWFYFKRSGGSQAPDTWLNRAEYLPKLDISYKTSEKNEKHEGSAAQDYSWAAKWFCYQVENPPYYIGWL